MPFSHWHWAEAGFCKKFLLLQGLDGPLSFMDI